MSDKRGRILEGFEAGNENSNAKSRWMSEVRRWIRLVGCFGGLTAL